jgi:4-hydroxybenzoate polyprenyltransferase
LLVLGRVSNLPTVWSNCLAGWLLSGGGSLSRLALVCLGTSCLYIGGMYLNDAFDAEFDRQHRPERPIPSGAIPEEKVWLWGLFWLGTGTLSLISLDKTTAILTLFLLASIMIYDAVHKTITFSPVLMSACRFFLFLVAASAGLQGVTGLAVWSALVLAAYIIGLSYVARKESAPGVLRYWPCSLLAAPIVLAVIANGEDSAKRAWLLSVILLLWVIRCLRHTFWAAERDIGRTVSGLLAGIVLVDLLAVAGATPWIGLVFVLLFVTALLFQRYIPAT